MGDLDLRASSPWSEREREVREVTIGSHIMLQEKEWRYRVGTAQKGERCKWYVAGLSFHGMHIWEEKVIPNSIHENPSTTGKGNLVLGGCSVSENSILQLIRSPPVLLGMRLYECVLFSPFQSFISQSFPSIQCCYCWMYKPVSFYFLWQYRCLLSIFYKFFKLPFMYSIFFQL